MLLMHNSFMFGQFSEPLYEQLKLLPISNIVANKRYLHDHELIAVSANTPCGDVFSVMFKHNISSVPVFVEALNKRKYVSIVSALDMLGIVLSRTRSTSVFMQWLDDSASLFKEPVSQAIRPQYWKDIVGFSSDPISKLIAAFVTSGSHRQIIINADRLQDDIQHEATLLEAPPLSLLSQTDLVAFLQTAYLDKKSILSGMLSTAFEISLGQLSGLARRVMQMDADVIAVDSKMTALDAFRVMYMTQVQALPVVDDVQKLVATISATDLRGLTPQTLKFLGLTAFELLESCSRPPQSVATDQIRSLRPDNFVYEAVEVMLSSKIHRVWLVDSAERVIGVVSLTDVLALFLDISSLNFFNL